MSATVTPTADRVVARTRIAKESANRSWMREIQVTSTRCEPRETASETPSVGWHSLPSFVNSANIDLEIGERVRVNLPISAITGTLMFYYVVSNDEEGGLEHHVMHIDKEAQRAHLFISTTIARRATIVWF
jgi:hypothetical protein